VITSINPILPGSTIGILGSGQLGRMLAIAARRMGYGVITYSPDTNTPTGQVADREIVGNYDDLDKIREFARSVNVITFEFENVSSAAVDAAAEIVPVRPRGNVLHITQNRLREKTFLSENGFPVAPFAVVRSQIELEEAVKRIGFPCVLKTAGFGYDGKGQVKLTNEADLTNAFNSLNYPEAVLEGFINFEREVSVVAARGVDGSFAHYGLLENIHRNHILDITIAPARVAPTVLNRAIELAHGILESLDVVGLLCVEMFQLASGDLIVNELAPRTHNSGHFSFDACITSQFEQQLRAVCGLPLGSTELLCPAVMVNLLGDLWQNGEPNWEKALGFSDVKLHLYGKAQARPGRKMGHMTALASTTEEALIAALAARNALTAESPAS